MYDDNSYNQVISQSYVNGRAISSFTYLRMDGTLLSPGPFNTFKNFVNRMHNL